LGLPITDDARDRETRIVERRAVGVRECVAELAALVDRAWCLGRRVARDPAREGKLPEQFAQPRLVPRNVRVELAVRPLEVCLRDHGRAAVPRAADEDRVELALADRSVE